MVFIPGHFEIGFTFQKDTPLRPGEVVRIDKAAVGVHIDFRPVRQNNLKRLPPRHGQAMLFREVAGVGHHVLPGVIVDFIRSRHRPSLFPLFDIRVSDIGRSFRFQHGIPRGCRIGQKHHDRLTVSTETYPIGHGP